MSILTGVKRTALTLACMMPAVTLASPDEHRFGLGAAVWGVLDDWDRGTTWTTYEFAEIESVWGIRPSIMAFVASNSRYYVSVGWLKEFDEDDGDPWSWGFGGQAGYFHNPGRLGYDIEFYSRILVNYDINENMFLRGEFGHISNAGFGDKNPGSENLTLSINWRF